MLGPKTDNSVTDSQNVNQVGHNSGTMNIGLTFEQHEQNVRERISELRADLERAHGAERERLQAQVDAAVASLSNLQSDYEKTLVELADLKATLARYDNALDRTKHAAADAALDRGDRTLARALLTELSAKARARREDASKEEAELEFKLGEIAETEIRWHDAAAHFAVAAKLNPTFDTLYKAREYAWRAGNYSAALRFGEDLLDLAGSSGTQQQLAVALNSHSITLYSKGHYGQAEVLVRKALAIDALTIGTDHSDYATHLNHLAIILLAQGRYFEAEPLYRQSLEISASTIGTDHEDYATQLNNHAGVLQELGQYVLAEGVFRRVLAIDASSIGKAHPAYATHLNNLAGAVRKQGRFSEAERLYLEVLAVDKSTIGPSHPDYATHLNNLAGAVEALGRYTEAEALFRQALAIGATTIGTGHPDYAARLNNLANVVWKQGRIFEADELYRNALASVRATLGDAHPNTHKAAKNLLTLLQTHFPDDPEIPALQALLAPTP
jgi:tetratricopeptide (TPR) repeat protein